MNETQVAGAVATWAAATLAEIETTYDYPVAAKLGKLPDAAAWVQRKLIAPRDERFPFLALEQVWLRVFEVELSLQIDSAPSEDEPTPQQREDAARAAHQLLESFGDRLEQALRADATLGGELDQAQPTMAAPTAEFDYSQPFVEYADGTRGRFMVVQLAIAEVMPEPA